MNWTSRQLAIIKTLGYETPQDFLNHFPIKYAHYQTKGPTTWREGDNVLIHGHLDSAFKLQRLGGKRSITRFSVFDGVQSIPVVVFNRAFLSAAAFKEGITVLGTVDKKGQLVAKTLNGKSLAENQGIQVQYGLKAGIKNYEIARLIAKILENEPIANVVPQSLMDAYKLMSRQHAMVKMHQPQSMDDVQMAARTLKYEEFLKYHVALAINDATRGHGHAHHFDDAVITNALRRLPYTLTHDQLASLNDILADMRGQKQMHRLVQGDVGSGKTIVAFLSALAAIASGYQVCFMVPTEILMHQHLANFQRLFPEIAAVSISFATESKKALLNEIQMGKPQMIFGTHSLFSKTLEFANLGLVIIDEQHRFGVDQRQALMQKGTNPDLLMLSATPIPRTLANALYFNLDVSTIESYPTSRQKTSTHLVHENSLRSIQSDVMARLNAGEQIYIVCPAVSDDARSGVRDVMTMVAQLTPVFAPYTVGFLHGQMSTSDKEKTMALFATNAIQILVCTTVIEVGIDVHNANTMVIYNAEQFGLATLHQLRGRVGRGRVGGVCYLLSGSDDEEAIARLNALKTTFNGFELSMIDMRHRGMGDALGTRQSGLPSFVLGDIEHDANILKQAKMDAHTIVADPHNPKFARIMNLIASQDYLKIL